MHAPVSLLQVSHAVQNSQWLLGTHRAPEQADAEFGPRGSHTDMWGFGTTLLHLATGQLPYQGLTPFQIMRAMDKKRSPDVPDTLPGWLQQLLKQCLTFDVAARPSAAQLLQVTSLTLQCIITSCRSTTLPFSGACVVLTWSCAHYVHA